MTPRETLESCRSMAQECSKIAELIEIAEKRIPMGPSASISVVLRDCPRGGNDATAAAIARVDGLEQWYQRDHAELVKLVEQVEIIIVVLDEWARKLIRSYYIDGRTDSEVAALMGWTRRATACESRSWVIAEIERST